MQARSLLVKSSFDYAVSNAHSISCNLFGIQSVRWRKPRWLPMAKSKIFKVPVRPQVPEAEVEELLRLDRNYKTFMKSTLAFLRDEVARKKELVKQSFTPTDEEAEFSKCLEINAKWNAEIELIRNERIAKEREQRTLWIQERLEAKAIRDKQMQEEFELKVKKQKELAPTFITRDNIDKAIEAALADKVDFTYAIDLQGNKITTNPTAVEQQPAEKSN